MSFGLSPGDIVAGIRLAYIIYDKGFAEENRADVRYTNFRNEILNFRILLERLSEALRGAQTRYVERGPVLGMRPHEPLSKEFEEERVAIVGNFQRTLKECEDLLERNKQFRMRDSNVLENLRYNLGKSEVQVDQLRSRLHFHAQKIRLVLDRLSLNLLTNLDDKVDDILAISEQNLRVSEGIQLELKKFHASWLGYVSGHGVPPTSASEGLHAVSASIAQRFEDTITLDAPAELTNGVPLIEGFDALLLHFERSSEAEGSDQTPEGYLLFLKARWLLDRIKAGKPYQNARPGLYYRRAINQVEQAILARISQPGQLVAYDESVLLQLPEACFHIWQSLSITPSVEYSQPSPLMIRGGEVKVAHIKLASGNMAEVDSVTILKSSDEHIRVVHESTPASTQGRVVITQHNVLVQEDRLIPRYAFPTLTTPCLEIDIQCRNVEEYFKFTCLEDLHNFQRALMGYDIPHDQRDIICQFSDNLSNLDCKGRVQLWQEPIGLASPAPGRDDQASPLLGASSLSSAGSRHDSIGSSIAATSTINATADGWQADPIKKAHVIIFAQLTDSKRKKRFAASMIELGEYIYVDPSSCQCHRDPSCKNVVLRHRKNTKLNVQTLLSESDANGQPNPSTFDIFPLRLPRHPDRAQRVHTKQTEYLVFAFKTLDEKNTFVQELNIRFAVRDQQIKDQYAFENSIRYRQDHPIKHRHTHGSLSSSPGSRHMSMCSTSPSSVGYMSSRMQMRHTGSISSTSTTPTRVGTLDEQITSPRRESTISTNTTVMSGALQSSMQREALETPNRGMKKVKKWFK